MAHLQSVPSCISRRSCSLSCLSFHLAHTDLLWGQTTVTVTCVFVHRHSLWLSVTQPCLLQISLLSCHATFPRSRTRCTFFSRVTQYLQSACFVHRRSSLGFGSEFFELLAKSNNRSDKVNQYPSKLLEKVRNKTGNSKLKMQVVTEGDYSVIKKLIVENSKYW